MGIGSRVGGCTVLVAASSVLVGSGTGVELAVRDGSSATVNVGEGVGSVLDSFALSLIDSVVDLGAVGSSVVGVVTDSESVFSEQPKDSSRKVRKTRVKRLPIT